MMQPRKLGLALTLALTLGFQSMALANNVSLTVNDGNIRDVIGALSSLSGHSIVTDDSVKGTISIDLTDIPFETALDIITRAKGLAYKTIGNVIVVSTADNVNKYYGNVSTYKLQYANAKEVVDALKGVVEKGLSFDPVTNSILFSGSTGDETKLRDALKVLDVATKQVTLEAKIISMNVNDAKELGLQWSWSELPERQTSDSGSSDDKMGGQFHIGFGYTARFESLLSALNKQGKANILATPRIITIPGKKASIFIGDHIPVVTDKTSSSGSTTSSTEYVDAGIKLEYTPIVSDDDFITATVHSEVSTPTKETGTQNYRITSRTADTNVRMRNGETLVIGGLINETEEKNMERVPLLSNIPILGELFKYRYNKKEKTEVMMILTPYITNAGESPAIYDNRVKNSTFSPVPGSQEDEDAKALAREAAALRAAKNSAVITSPGARAEKIAPIEKQKSNRPLTMRERAEQLLAEQKK